MITLIILGSACFSFFMVEIVRWHKRMYDPLANDFILDRKPFNCTTCLSGWTGFIVSILSGYLFESFLVMFISAVAGLILDNGVKKYL